MTVTGTPRLTLETGATDRPATYASGSARPRSCSHYAVQNGDTSPDLNYTSTGALALNGGTIRDAAGTTRRSPSRASPPPARSLPTRRCVNPGPTIVSVTPPSAVHLRRRDRSISPSPTARPSPSTRTPARPRSRSPSARAAGSRIGLSGSGTDQLVFRYTVQPGDNDTNGIALANDVSLWDGTIRSAQLIDASNDFTARPRRACHRHSAERDVDPPLTPRTTITGQARSRGARRSASPSPASISRISRS